MMKFGWRTWFNQHFRLARHTRRSSTKRVVLPDLEALEDRTVLSFTNPVISDYAALDGFLAHEATGDFNGDGNVDIAVLTYTQIGSPVELTVLQGDGQGSFQAQTSIDLHNTETFGTFTMAVGRINNDSFDDLALLNGNFELKVFTGGQSGLTAGNSIATALTTSFNAGVSAPGGPIVLGHFQQADRLDAVILADGGDTARLMVNQGNGSFTEQPVVLKSGTHTVSVANGASNFDEGNQAATEDFNGDGVTDAIFAFGSVFNSGTQTGVLTIKATGGSDVFAVTSVATVAANGQDLQAGDIDADGLLDLAVNNHDGSGGLILLNGQADGSFQAFAASPFTGGNPAVDAASFVLGTLVDGPGADLAIAPESGVPDLAHGGQKYVFDVAASAGDGTYGPITTIDRHLSGSNESPITEAGHLLTADVDHDGTADLINIYTSFGTARTSVILNTGATHTSLAFPELEEGSPITIVATVDKSSPTLDVVPSGSVTFKEGNTVLGQATLVNGVATSDLLFLDPGNHTITATYSGDGNFLSSVAPPSTINVIVNPGRTKTTASFPNLVEGQSVVSVNVTKYFAATEGSPEGTVTFMNGTDVVGTANVVGGQAIAPLDLDAGDYTITAVYSGNGTFTTSKSAAMPITITSPPLPDLGLLHVTADGNGLTFNRSNQHFEADGVIHIGLAAAPSESLLDLSGSVSIGDGKIVGSGTVTAHVGTYTAVLFEGDFEFDIGGAETNVFDFPPLPSSIKIAGLQVDFHQIELVDGGLNLSASLHLPDLFGGQIVDLALGAGIHIDANGISSHFGTGAGIGFPNLNFDLAGLGITASDLNADYDAPQDRLKLQGKLKLPDLFGAVIAGPTVDLTGNNYIQIKNGAVSVVGDLTVKRIDIVPNEWYLKDVKLHFDTITNSFEGSGTLFLPGGFGISADLGVVNGRLDTVEVGVDGLNLPVPFLPGAFVKSISGGVEGLTTATPTFTGDVDFTYLPAVTFDLPGFLGGQHFSVSLVSLDVGAEVNANHLSATGTVELLKGVDNSGGNGSPASVDLDWLKRIIHVSTDVHLFDNIVNLDADFTANAVGNVTFQADATINLPDIDTGFLGIHIAPQTLAGAHLEFQFTNDHNSANDYVSLYGNVNLPIIGNRHIGVRVHFNGSVDFLGLKDPVGQTFNIPANTDAYLLTASWENDVGDVPIEIVDPNGVTYTEADFDNSAIGLVAPLSGPTSKSVGLSNPIPGDWTIRIPNETGLGQIALHAFHEIPAPTVDITSATPGANGIDVVYDAQSSEPGATVSFYYDTDDSGEDGPLIATDGSVGNDQSFLWDTTGVAAGTYHLYAKVDDGINPPVFAYFPSAVVIDNVAPSVATIQDQTVNEGETLSLTASATDHNGDIVTYSLGVNTPDGVDIDPATGDLTWTPTEAQGPANYNITVIATDTGTPALTGSQTFQVTVNEVNTAPTLNKIFARSTPAGGTISFAVTANDIDSPAQTLIYSLDPGAPLNATIDPSTGEFEWVTDIAQAPGIYPITFRVTDSGTPALSSTSTVNFAVTNASPAAIPGVLAFSAAAYEIDEGGNLVVTVQRTGGSDGVVAVQYATSGGTATVDDDYTDTNGLLIFEDGVTSLTFTLPAKTDAIEELDETLTLTLSNPFGGATIGSVNQSTVTIHDVAPVIPPVNPEFSTAATFNAAENQAAVGTVLAADPGFPERQISYSITGGADAAGFSISNAGVITFNSAPDFETPADNDHNNVYELQVTASDGSGGSTAQNITVTVTDVQELIPAGLQFAGQTVTWVKKHPPVVVLPDVTVTGDIQSGDMLLLQMDAVGKKKPLDTLHIPAFNTIGTSSGPVFANGHLTLQIQLNSSATAVAVRNLLEGITFTTKGKGLKAPTRTLTATLTPSGGTASLITQTIHVMAKSQ